MLLSILNSLQSDSYALMIALVSIFWAFLAVAANFDFPGVEVNEATAGAIPIDRRSFRAIKLVGTALRGPAVLSINDKPQLITREKQFHDIFGANWEGSYLDDAVRAIFNNVDSSVVYITRVVGAGAAKATKTLKGGGTSQVETATAAGSISGSGNVLVTITAAGMGNSPKAINVAVLNGDTAAVVAGKIRTALAADSDVSAFFDVSGSGISIVLTRKVHAANDATMNIALATGTATGLTAAPTSVDTTAGVADVDVLQIDSWGPGADYNYVSSPAAGLSVTYVDGLLTVYDKGVAIETFRDVLYTNYGAARDFINGNSNLIRVTWVDNTKNPINYGSATGLTGGADGSAVVASDIAGNSSNKTGVYSFARKDLPLGFILAPGYPQASVGNALLIVAEDYRQLALIDSTFGNSVSSAITERNQFAAPKGHLIYCYGWVQVVDPDTGALKYVPRSPFRAAHIARSHNQPGFLANVGAGLDYVLRGAVGLETGEMDDLTQGEINVLGIDVARNFSYAGQGLVHWAMRTISTNPLYRFLQVRVIMNVTADSMEIGLRPYIGKPYDGRGRMAAQVVGSINQLLYDLWRQDVLFGRTHEEAFNVKNMSTLTELEQGIVNIDVFIKPTPVIERINVTLYRVPLSFNFTTGEVTVGDIESRA